MHTSPENILWGRLVLKCTYASWGPIITRTWATCYVAIYNLQITRAVCSIFNRTARHTSETLTLGKMELNGEHKFKLVELKNKMPKVLPKIIFLSYPYTCKKWNLMENINLNWLNWKTKCPECYQKWYSITLQKLRLGGMLFWFIIID